jgi:hypothetical protein
MKVTYDPRVCIHTEAQKDVIVSEAGQSSCGEKK